MMSRRVVVLLLVVLTALAAMSSSLLVSSSVIDSREDVATSPSSAYTTIFAGRSSRIALTSSTLRDMHAMFYDRTGSFLHRAASELSSTVYDVADVFTRALGVESLQTSTKAPSSLATALLRTSIFSRPTLAVLLTVDGMSAADVSADDSASSNAPAAATRASLSSRDFTSVSSSLSAAASLATTVSTSEHGIVSAQWRTKGQVVHAYTDATGTATHANLADVVTQSTSGRGLTVSISSDEQFASAFSVHPRLVAEHPDWLNVKTVTHDWRVQMTPSTLSVLSHPAVARAFSVKSAQDDSRSCVSIAEKATVESVTVCSGDVAADATALSPLAALVAELQSVFVAPDDLRVQFVGELADKVPDVISVSLVSLPRCAARLSAKQLAFARRLVAAALPALMDAYLSLAPQSIGAVVLLDTSSLIELSASSPSSASLAAFEAAVRAHYPLAPNTAATLPNLFFADVQTGAEIDSVDCFGVNAALAPHGLSATCIDAAVMRSLSSMHSFGAMTVANYGCLNTTSPYPNVTRLFPNNTFPSNDDIGRYHTVMWFSIAITLVALSAIYAIAFMQFKKDTMLYSSFNPNWEDRKRR